MVSHIPIPSGFPDGIFFIMLIVMGFREYIRNKFVEDDKAKVLREAMEFCQFNSVHGKYFEFGVWKGDSFLKAYKAAEIIGLKNMEFVAFDSFQGLPVPKSEEKFFLKKGDYSCNLEDFLAILLKNKVDLKKVFTVHGFYNETLKSVQIKFLENFHASVIYIDSDLYESAVCVLDFIVPYLQEGTIILFDDWNIFKGNNEMGERKAFKEWTARNNVEYSHFKDFSWHGTSFIIHKWRKPENNLKVLQ